MYGKRLIDDESWTEERDEYSLEGETYVDGERHGQTEKGGQEGQRQNETDRRQIDRVIGGQSDWGIG